MEKEITKFSVDGICGIGSPPYLDYKCWVVDDSNRFLYKADFN